MSTSVSFDRVDGVLVARVTGRYQADEALGAFATLLDACRTDAVDRVLIDLRTLEGEGSATLEIIYRQRVTALWRRHVAAGGGPVRVAYLGGPNFIRGWEPGTEDPARAGLEVLATTLPEEAAEWLARNVD